jgi:hypothetical protein
MFVRAIIGLMIGTIGGALIGAIIFGIGQWLYPTGIDLLLSGWPLAAIVGAFIVGLPGGCVGLIVGLSGMNKVSAAVAGLIAGAITLSYLAYMKGRLDFPAGVWLALLAGLPLVGFFVAIKTSSSHAGQK